MTVIIQVSVLIISKTIWFKMQKNMKIWGLNRHGLFRLKLYQDKKHDEAILIM